MAEEKETQVEQKEENKSSNNGGKKEYHLIKENFNKAIIWGIIGLGIITVIEILIAVFNAVIDNNILNLIRAILNAVECGGLIVVGIVELKLFINDTNPNRDKDIASFIISLVAFIIAFLTAVSSGIEVIRNLIWFF